MFKYLQQLAIITPYAQLELEYHNHANPKKDLTAVWDRRSGQMPPLAYEVKHHPGSVNNLLVQQLIHRRVIGRACGPSERPLSLDGCYALALLPLFAETHGIDFFFR